MKSQNYSISTDRNIRADEFDALMSATGWGNDGYFTQEVVARHFSVISYLAHIRDDSGKLSGYMSAIDNGYGVFLIDTIAIHPEASQEEAGRMLVSELSKQCCGRPLYAMPFMDQQDVFLAEGFRIPGRPMAALSSFRSATRG
jgi:hypothetical protein